MVFRSTLICWFSFALLFINRCRLKNLLLTTAANLHREMGGLDGKDLLQSCGFE